MTQPTAQYAHVGGSATFTVSAESDNSVVTISLNTNPGGGTLSGTLTLAGSNTYTGATNVTADCATTRYGAGEG